jgi:hypothetical protein
MAYDEKPCRPGVGRDAHADALTKPHTRPMDFTGRPMKGFIYVAPAVAKTDRMLTAWIQQGLDGIATKKKKSQRDD